MNNVLMRQGVDMKPRKQINQDKMICPDCGKSKSRVMPYCDDCLGKHLITCDDCRSQIERDIIKEIEKFGQIKYKCNGGETIMVVDWTKFKKSRKLK